MVREDMLELEKTTCGSIEQKGIKSKQHGRLQSWMILNVPKLAVQDGSGWYQTAQHFQDTYN